MVSRKKCCVCVFFVSVLHSFCSVFSWRIALVTSPPIQHVLSINFRAISEWSKCFLSRNSQNHVYTQCFRSWQQGTSQKSSSHQVKSSASNCFRCQPHLRSLCSTCGKECGSEIVNSSRTNMRAIKGNSVRSCLTDCRVAKISACGCNFVQRINQWLWMRMQRTL